MTSGWKFIDEYHPGQAHTLEPITKLEREKGKTFKQLWGKVQKESYNRAKYEISRLPPLPYPTLDGKFMIHSDASDVAGGVAIFQEQWRKQLMKKKWCCIAFSSWLIPQQYLKQPIGVKELWVAVRGFLKYKYYLLRDHFYWITDHINLVWLFQKSLKSTVLKDSIIAARLLMKIAPFWFQIRHANGVDIGWVDYLSRIVKMD